MVTKVPRFAFEKFKQADDRLTTQMKSVGEVMAIGRTFQESLQKALRGLEVGRRTASTCKSVDMEKIEDELAYPRAERLWYVADAFGVGMSVEEVHRFTRIDPWFLGQIEELVDIELAIEKKTLADFDARRALRGLKRKGFSDRRLAYLLEDHGARGAQEAPRARHPPGLQARGHLRGGVRDRAPPTCTPPTTRRTRREPTNRQEDHDAGRRAQPHRPGHRVRLLLRARGARPARGRLRDHHGQLQPGDGLHRLRHLGPALLRAAHARGRAGDRRHARSPRA